VTDQFSAAVDTYLDDMYPGEVGVTWHSGQEPSCESYTSLAGLYRRIAQLEADNDALRRQLMARERDTGTEHRPRPAWRWGNPV